jgi:hypothetical protein
MKDTREIFGIVEHVSLPILGLFDIAAKIDTGAFSGAMHVTDIKEYINEKGKKRLEFILPITGKKIDLGKFTRTYVRSSTGHQQRRYLFDTTVMVNNVEYPIRIGLSDRSDMSYEILIGRRFLHEHNILVDVKHNQEYDLDRGKKV